MTSIRWLGSPTCSAASPTSHKADVADCCNGIGTIRTCGCPLEPWRPSPTSSRSGVLPRSWAAMKTCYGSCPTSSSPKTVYDIDGAETPAFTHDGIEALREIIKDQIDRAS